MFKSVVTFMVLLTVFLTLIGLGLWQLQRLEWKRIILADIAEQESVDPMTTPLDLSQSSHLSRGYLDGDFLRVKPIRLTPRTDNGRVGYHLLMPFQTTSGTIILVNLGWVSNDAETVPIPAQVKRIAGYLKSPDAAGQFTPQNNPDLNLFYSVDIDGLAGLYRTNLYPQVLYLESPLSDLPKSFQGLPKPRNNHAQYAAFWFGMAGLLIVLSGLVYWQQRRLASLGEA